MRVFDIGLNVLLNLKEIVEKYSTVRSVDFGYTTRSVEFTGVGESNKFDV